MFTLKITNSIKSMRNENKEELYPVFMEIFLYIIEKRKRNRHNLVKRC